ncbi:MAG: radical SAM protein, partial [Desulfurococcaceae archaeon]
RFACSRLHGPEDEPRSFETGSRLREFSLILTSIHYEPDIVNLARLLLSGGISVLAGQRGEHVVIAGGPACMENPIPYSDVVDACIVGEAEETLEKVINLWLEYGGSKKRFLEELASLSYVYVPGLSNGIVVRKYARDLNTSFYPIKQVENTDIEPVYGRGFKLEVSRGCIFWCSFCVETRLFQPYRERGLSTLKGILERGLNYSLAGKRVVIFSLVFPATQTHYKLLEYLEKEGYIASIPSLRVSPYLEKALELIRSLGQRTLTLAPESFSPIVQSVLFKYTGLLEYVNNILEEAIKMGFDLKLYLIYGFKGLENTDLEVNSEHLNRLIKTAKQFKRRMVVSFTPLIPKPHTLFQWVGMLPRDRLASILRAYRNRLKGPVETRVYDIDWAIIQAQLALSPRPLGSFIEQWAKCGGGLAGWRRAMRDLGVNYEYVFTGYSPESQLPWGFIALGDEHGEVAKSQYVVYEKLARSL